MKLRNILLLALTAVSVFAQTLPSVVPAQPATFINGDLVIRFDTRTNLDGSSPRTGVTDKYRITLNVNNSVKFDGSIEYLPYISGTFGNQVGKLTHAVECYVINPKNPTQVLNIGRLFGTVPVNENNVYNFTAGNLKIGAFARGSVAAFESKASGLALGKPPVKSGFFNKIVKDAIKLGRQAQGKTSTIVITNYDQMKFETHVLAGGPMAKYPEASVNGPMVYDYDRTAWFFNGVTVSYVADGVRKVDTLSGNIRWVESPQRQRNGEGEYQFDIRINEPTPSESAMFKSAANEDDFFAADNQIPSLSGTMKYKDTMIDGQVTASVVSIDLKGNQLTQQQVMYLGKLLLMSSIVPLNAE